MIYIPTSSLGRVSPPLLIFLFAVMLDKNVFADSLMKANYKMLERYDLYDLNVEVSFNAKVKDVILADSGPVVIEVLKNEKTYGILVSPRWYFDKMKIDVREGDEIEVKGAKVVIEGNRVLILARVIRNKRNGKTYLLRRGECPCWARCRTRM